MLELKSTAGHWEAIFSNSSFLKTKRKWPMLMSKCSSLKNYQSYAVSALLCVMVDEDDLNIIVLY